MLWIESWSIRFAVVVQEVPWQIVAKDVGLELLLRCSCFRLQIYPGFSCLASGVVEVGA